MFKGRVKSLSSSTVIVQVGRVVNTANMLCFSLENAFQHKIKCLLSLGRVLW